MAGEVDRDHPRACGEHRRHRCFLESRQGSSPRMRGTRAIIWAGFVLGGSSPRMRGTLGGLVAGLHDEGIIPAHAGNTTWSALGCN